MRRRHRGVGLLVMSLPSANTVDMGTTGMIWTPMVAGALRRRGSASSPTTHGLVLTSCRGVAPRQGDGDDAMPQLLDALDMMDARKVHHTRLLPSPRKELARLARRAARAASPVAAGAYGAWESPLAGRWRLALTDEASWLGLLPFVHDVYLDFFFGGTSEAGSRHFSGARGSEGRTMSVEYGASLSSRRLLVNSVRLRACCEVLPGTTGEVVVYTIDKLIAVIAGLEVAVPLLGRGKAGSISLDFFDGSTWVEKGGAGAVAVYRHVPGELSGEAWGATRPPKKTMMGRLPPAVASGLGRALGAGAVAWRVAALASLSAAAAAVLWPMAVAVRLPPS